ERGTVRQANHGLLLRYYPNGLVTRHTSATRIIEKNQRGVPLSFSERVANKRAYSPTAGLALLSNREPAPSWGCLPKRAAGRPPWSAEAGELWPCRWSASGRIVLLLPVNIGAGVDGVMQQTNQVAEVGFLPDHSAVTRAAPHFGGDFQ